MHDLQVARQEQRRYITQLIEYVDGGKPSLVCSGQGALPSGLPSGALMGKDICTDVNRFPSASKE